MIEHIIISDLHIDVKDFDFSVYNVEENLPRTIIVAGDTLTDTFNGLSIIYNMLVKLSGYFKNVFYVFGNHDFNGTKILNQQQQLIYKCNKFHSNIHVLTFQQSPIIIDDVAYWGDTFWPYMNPAYCEGKEKFIGDYMAIKGEGTPNLTFYETNNLAKKAYNSLVKFVDTDYNTSKKVVITHVPPIYIPSGFTRNWLSDYFYNELTFKDMTVIKNIDYWFHGHVHQQHYKYVDGMRIMNNARGYPNEIYPKFDPYNLIVEI